MYASKCKSTGDVAGTAKKLLETKVKMIESVRQKDGSCCLFL